jgi:adenosine deaminase
MMTEAELRALPKVELHLHLDCSMSYRSVSALVPAMTRERYEAEFLAPRKCKSLIDYFRYLAPPLKLLQTREALSIQTVDLMRQLAEDNVIYAEVRFAPHLHRQNGLSTAEVVETVLAAMEDGRRLHSVEARLILCTLRPDNTILGLDLVDIADRYRDLGVGGIDLAGDEAGYPLTKHVPVFREAAARGLNITAHAGEAAGAQSVREVVEKLGVRRVGHGIRSIEDPHVLDLLVERGVHLEVCPSCNIQIDVYDRYENHPVDRLRQLGISLGINTDARGPTALTLVEEYQRLHHVFGWTEPQFQAANRAALSVAFVGPKVRETLSQKL